MRELICINCPRGCHLVVDDKLNVTGNACPRGAKYALEEISHPVRYVASTVAVSGSIERRVSVTTDQPIPKADIFKLMDLLRDVEVKAPIHIGQIIIPHVLGTASNVVATKEIKE